MALYHPHLPSGPGRQAWDNLIRKYGMPAVLRQTGLPDRSISCILGQFSSLERMGSVSNPADMKAIVSSLDPNTDVEVKPPPSERDVLVVTRRDGSEMLLKIVAPPAYIGPRSVVSQLYWRLQVRR